MNIVDYKLVLEDGRSFDLPHLASDSVVYVWEVPTSYRDSGLFISTHVEGNPREVPGSKHTDPIFVGNLPADPEEVFNASFNDALQQANQRLSDEYQRRSDGLSSGYPENEQKSWPIQVEEAKLALSDLDDPEETPWLNNASAERGISRQEMATLIRNMDKSYRQIHGALSGRRQALRNTIFGVEKTEEGIEFLNQFNWTD